MQYEIEAGDYRATVTELGAGLRELLFRGQPVIAGYPPDGFPQRGRASCSRHGRTGLTAAGTCSTAPSCSWPSPNPLTPTLSMA